MIPVIQTRRGQGGNCLAACVASILEKPLDMIDPLIQIDHPGDEWMQPLHDYLLADKTSLLYIPATDSGDIPMHSGHPFYAIANVETNAGFPHAVVVRIEPEGAENVIRLSHDPEPGSSGIKSLRGIWVFAKTMTD